MRKLETKTNDQLRLMRQAGLVVAEGLAAMQAATLPGITTAEIDQVGRDVLREHGATSNFLNYGSEYGPGFAGVACISVNNELLHGIPGNRVIKAGDLVSLDFGAIVSGWHGDAARSFVVGQAQAEQQELIAATREAFWAGLPQFRPGVRVNEISRAIEFSVLSQPRSYGIVRDYTGHGIGTRMHMAPDVPNYARARLTPKLRPGIVLAIEPMLTLGSDQTEVLADEWTVVSVDGSIGAHWENTVALTEHGLWVLTEPDGGQAELARLGLPFGGLA